MNITYVLLSAGLFGPAYWPSASAWPTDYCAFEVIVKAPDGSPVRTLSVEELKQDSDELVGDSGTDEHGFAKICEAPVGQLVKIRVGGRLCGAVTVAYLKPFWMQTRRVFVTYENCAGEEWNTMGGCSLTIRIRDSSGQALVGARFVNHSSKPEAPNQTAVSDQYGRILRFMGYRGTLDGTVDKAGYTARAVSADCAPGSDTERERIVVLERIGSPLDSRQR